jgi:hypothetical protein
MDPNQQPPQYPPQFFYPDPNQQMYPPQGVQPMMMQPGMVAPQYQMPQQHQQVVMMPTTGYMVQPQSPTMTMVAAPMGHNVVPATIPQQVAYVTPSPDNVSLLTSPTPSPFDQSIKERLFQREYTVDIKAWISEAWDIYKKNYAVFILWTLINFAVSWIPYVGIFAMTMMTYCLIAAVNDSLRPSRTVLNFKNFGHLFESLRYTLHMLILTILVNLIVAAGFIALIVPGFYFLIVLAYTVNVYLEYRTLGLQLTEAIWVSGKVLHKRFCGIFGYFIVCFLLMLAGALALGVGLLITYPLVYISMSVAFREIFSFRENHLYASEQQI